jgi:3-oxoacyl-[acyl-carrier protein] reductase
MRKVVIVTGATRGLGLAVAVQAAAEGYAVVGVARSCSKGLHSLLHRYPDQVFFENFDFTALGQIHDFAKDVVKRHGRPWGLVNNAAIGSDGVLATQHESEISTLLRVNIEAPILLTKYILRPMLICGAGRIVNVSSIIANTGFSGLAVYAATKAAMLGFTRSLAREVGRAGITVNSVAPGYMQTDMTQALDGDKLASIKRRSPLGRLAQPSDVALAITYLLGEGAAAMTGTNLTVDAGSTA